MKTNGYLSEEQLLEKAVAILTEELGPLETSRFLSLPSKKRLESVKRHRLWQSKLNKEKFLKEVFNK